MAIRIVPVTVPTPFPIGPVNAYLLPDAPATLVDVGPKTPEARQAVAAALAAADVPVGALRRIILTHAHTDHFGLAASLAASSGAAVLAHPADAAKFAGDPRIVGDLAAFLRQSGVPDALTQGLGQVLQAHRRLLDPLPTYAPLADGQTLVQGEGALTVLHTPGHSSGHVCLLADGRLIAGDVLLEEISTNPVVDFASDGRRIRTLPLLLASLRRLRALDPLEVLPGHGAPFGPAAPRIDALLAHHAERTEQVFALLGAEPRTAFDLAQVLFPGVDTLNLMLAVSEVTGHLDLLLEEGRVAEVRLNGRLGYRAVRR